MRKRWWVGFSLGLLGLLVLAGVGPASAQTGRFWLQAIGDNNEAITSGRCLVFTNNANTLATIYTTVALSTTASNPLTVSTANGVCEWFMPTSTTTVDVIMVVDGGAYKGHRIRVDDVTRTGQHTVRVNRASGLKVLAVPFTATASADVQTTTYTLPAGAAVERVTVQTTTAVTGAFPFAGLSTGIAVGLAGHSAAALCSDARTNQIGLVNCPNTAQTLPYTALSATATTAVTYHNQNHATAGFAWVFYTEAGPVP